MLKKNYCSLKLMYLLKKFNLFAWRSCKFVLPGPATSLDAPVYIPYVLLVGGSEFNSLVASH